MELPWGMVRSSIASSLLIRFQPGLNLTPWLKPGFDDFATLRPIV
jgi:hypothetical protein